MDKQQAIEALRKQIERVEDGFVESNAHDAAQLPNKPSCGCADARSKGVKGPNRCDGGKGKQGGTAFNKIVALINASEKSSCELRKRLAQAGFDEEETQNALKRAVDCGLVDDMRYASILIRSRLNQGWGLDGIERELERNGINPFDIEGWPEGFPFGHDEQVSRALDMLEKKPPHARNLRDAAYRKLVKRGYSSSIASQAAGIWYESLNRS